MDFPLFHLDFFGNRTLIGVIAVIHVLINHPLAVGAMPLITLMEWWGHRTGQTRWDTLAYRILAVCFVVTTSLGALTGVGIWLSTSLVNPDAIGSLIRVFFWGWFTEWIIFVSEVSLILIYFLTWKNWGARNKGKHIAVGIILSICSWLTMAIIVAILGFMMDPGDWTTSDGLLRAVMNPIYLPQLLFRTPVALATAGLFGMFLAYFFTRNDREFRPKAVRFLSLWTLAWTLPVILGSLLYRSVIPEAMIGNLPVAVATQAFENWYANLVKLIAAAGGLLVIVTLWGAAMPRRLPRVVLLVPFVVAIALLGYFERVREFVRKPDVIGTYMYANGIRRADYPLMKEQGILKFATYAHARTITDANRMQAGQDVFRIACTRCHTTTGVNGVRQKLSALYGDRQWVHSEVTAYVRGMHNVRPFMPPFPGNEEELSAMVDYLLTLQNSPAVLTGAQVDGVQIAPPAQDTNQ